MARAVTPLRTPKPARVSPRSVIDVNGFDLPGFGGTPPPVIINPPVPTTITPSPSATKNLAQAAAQQLTIAALDAVIPVVYGGPVQLGGNIVMCEEIGQYLFCAYVLCWGEINSVSSILFGDATPAQLGLILNTDYFVYLGTAAQTLNSMLHTADARWIYAYNGTETNSEGGTVPQVAYVAVRFKRRGPSLPAADPMRFSAIVEGLKIRDHRLDPSLTTRYYEPNPALASADFKTDARFGEGEPDSIFGDWSTVDGSADACDVLCSDGLTKRYVIALDMRTQDTGENNYLAILAHFMGYSVFNEGQLKMYADVAVASFSGAKAFSDGSDGGAINIRGDEFVTIHTKGIEEIPSCVEVQYTASLDGYQTKSVFVPDESSPKDNLVTYQMPGIPTLDQAHRTGIKLYNRGRNDKLFTLPLSAEWLEALPGNPVTISTYGGLSATQAVITDVKARGGSYTGGYAVGFLYDAAAYSDIVQTEDSPITSTLPDPNALPPAPTSMSVSEYVAADSSGRAVSVLLVTLTTGDTSFYHRTRLTLDRGDGNGELTVGYINGAANSVQVERIDVPVLSAVNTVKAYTQAYPHDLESTPASQTITPIFNSTPPSAVTGLNAPFSTIDNMGTVWWTTPVDKLIQTVVVFVQVNGSWVRVWSHDAADARALVSSSSVLNLKPFIQTAGDGSQSFAVRVLTLDKIGTASLPVDASWYIPNTLAPITKILSADTETTIRSGSNTSWANAQSGANLTENDGLASAQSLHRSATGTPQPDHSQFIIDRIFALFATSAIPDTAVISQAYLLINHAAAVALGVGLIEVYESTALHAPAQTTDFGQFNATLLGSLAVSAIGAGFQNVRIDLNASGIALINLTGNTKFCIRDSYDVSNTDPGSGNQQQVISLATVAHNVQLVVVYTLPGGTGGVSGGSAPPVFFAPADISGAITGTTGSDGNPTFVLPTSGWSNILVYYDGKLCHNGGGNMADTAAEFDWVVGSKTFVFRAPYIPIAAQSGVVQTRLQVTAYP